MLLKVVEPPSLSSSTSSSSQGTSPATTASSAPHFRDITIKPGELYVLPPHTPHNPVRFANTVGVVVELPRPKGAVDKLRWYCQECSAVVHEKQFVCTDLGTQIKRAVEEFKMDQEARRCGGCGALCAVTRT